MISYLLSIANIYLFIFSLFNILSYNILIAYLYLNYYLVIIIFDLLIIYVVNLLM
jgi:hypothetical protein